MSNVDDGCMDLEKKGMEVAITGHERSDRSMFAHTSDPRVGSKSLEQ